MKLWTSEGGAAVNSVGPVDAMLRSMAHAVIRAYQLTLSALIGRHCRHWPSCSDYTDTAIQRHGVWAGGWVGLARLCRCRPWGSFGVDPVPVTLPNRARWFAPWRFGDWRGPRDG